LSVSETHHHLETIEAMSFHAGDLLLSFFRPHPEEPAQAGVSKDGAGTSA